MSLEAFLFSLPLFAHLGPGDQRALLRHASTLRCQAGDVIIQEGTLSEHLYIIVTGAVKVDTASFGRQVELKTLQVGEYFGEVSLMSGKAATATVTAQTSPVQLIALHRDGVLELASRDETLRQQLEGITMERAKDTIVKVLQ